MPRTVLAAVMPAPHLPVDVREFPEPDLPPGGALLRTALSEVCGTDVHLWHGRLSGVPYPIIPGHVTTGTLDAIRGSLVDMTGDRLREGDRVAFFDVHRTCGRCLACTAHRTPTRCPSRRVYGITDSATEGLFGGWAQKVYLEPGVIVARLPEGVSFEAYIGGGCGLLTAVHIIERSRIALGDTVVVQGAGAVGMSAAALARQSGAGQVILIGAPDSRLELSRTMGADTVISIERTTPDERLEQVLALTGRLGADVVIEAAGSARAFEEGVTLVRNGGAYVIAGHYTDTGDSTINAHEHINRKHLDIRGCWGSEVGHFLRALRVLERHHHEVPWHLIGAQTFGLGQINQALEIAAALTIPKALVDPWR
jgi:threonine dehydrogenase-like Zn-dependent dehydrogenase